jgi:Pyruvate/2-oxoacid:ferredoxin oxidoreductase gamma subunit
VGAVVKILKLAKIKSVLEAVREGVPVKPEDNAAAAKEAYEKS